MDPRIQEMLDAGRLIHQPAPDTQVAGLWRDGLGAYAFARAPDRPPAQRLTAVHDTARMASLALLRAAGLRERAKGDRATALEAAARLGGEELSALLGRIRDRDQQSAISADDVDALVPVAREMLMRVRDAIGELRPAAVDGLAPIPGRDATPPV